MATDKTAPEEQPSAEDMRKGQQVAMAAGAAAAQAETAEQARTEATQAVRRTADQVKLELSDDDIHRIVNELVDVLEQRGAFDPPAPPPAAEATPAEAGEAAGATAEPVVPAKRSFAERFLGS